MSLTTVHKHIIESACQKALAHVDKTRVTLYEQAIIQQRADSTRGWFGLVKTPISREQAIEKLKDLETDEWAWLDCDWVDYGSGIKNRAQRLIKSVELTGENLLALDNEDVVFVHNWK